MGGIAILVLAMAASSLATSASEPLKLQTCSQSSTSWSGDCSRAIDGITNQRYFNKSCSHTNNEKGWWMASTSKPAQIEKVRIYNRVDCCSRRLNDFAITVDGQECASYRSNRGFSVKTFICNKVGRSVMIKNRMTSPLTLCEVQVFGEFFPQSKSLGTAGTHLGCFRDREVRDLTHKAYTGTNSPQLCQTTCRKLGYMYSGVQYSEECWCGNSYGRYGLADNCNMPCVPNDGQICGGGWANSVYTAGDQVAIAADGALGCFEDKRARDLPRMVHAGVNSPDLCKASCKILGYQFAGVQFAEECWCGNSYGKYGQADNCDMPCTSSAAKGQMCGGRWANFVYKLAA